MNNNDIIRRIRYIFDFSDAKMIEVFALADLKVTRSQISDWMKKYDDPELKELDNDSMTFFLNGLINDKRSKSEVAQPEEKLNNNIIFRKLRIALNLKDYEIVEIIKLAGMQISKHELSAFFRNPTKSQYRECNNQILRNFLKGLQIKYRTESK